MVENKIILVAQLVNALNGNFSAFEEAYNNSDKEKFDGVKSSIIEIQKKIDKLVS